MESLKTVMFIDGQNFSYNLNAFRFYPKKDSNQYFALQEKHFNWEPFFKGIVSKFNRAFDLKHR